MGEEVKRVWLHSYKDGNWCITEHGPLKDVEGWEQLEHVAIPVAEHAAIVSERDRYKSAAEVWEKSCMQHEAVNNSLERETQELTEARDRYKAALERIVYGSGMGVDWDKWLASEALKGGSDG